MTDVHRAICARSLRRKEVVCGHHTGDRPFQPSISLMGSRAIVHACDLIRHRAPWSTVVVFPSDHFVYPEEGFVQAVKRIIGVAERLQDRIVLLGVRPDAAECEYGWVHPGEVIGWATGHAVRTVDMFLEKPGQEQARRAIKDGALWNTLVLAAKVETMWRLGWQCFPALMEHFEELDQVIGTGGESRMLDRLYVTLPEHNFSQDLLATSIEQTAIMEMTGVLWSDWGRPERVLECIQRIGKLPHFPVEAVGAIAHSQLPSFLSSPSSELREPRETA